MPEIHLYARVLGYEGGAHVFADGTDVSIIFYFWYTTQTLYRFIWPHYTREIDTDVKQSDALNISHKLTEFLIHLGNQFSGQDIGFLDFPK